MAYLYKSQQSKGGERYEKISMTERRVTYKSWGRGPKKSSHSDSTLSFLYKMAERRAGRLVSERVEPSIQRLTCQV